LKFRCGTTNELSSYENYLDARKTISLLNTTVIDAFTGTTDELDEFEDWVNILCNQLKKRADHY